MSSLRGAVVRLIRLLGRRPPAPSEAVRPAPPTLRAPPPPPPPPAPASGQVLTHVGMPVRVLFDDGTVLELVADPILERRLAQLLGGIRTKGTRAEVSGGR